MEAARLRMSFTNWAKKTPIKVEGPAQSGVQSPAPLTRPGWERLPVYRKDHD